MDDRSGFNTSGAVDGPWRQLQQSLQASEESHALIAAPALEASDHNAPWSHWDEEDSSESFGAGTTVGWLIWTLASAVPLFSAAAWLTVAFRRRRMGLLYETVAAATWPLFAFFIFTVLTVLVSTLSVLLFFRHDYDEHYREHADTLIEFHDAYHWTGTPQQLGDVGGMGFEFDQENGVAEALMVFWTNVYRLLMILTPMMWLASLVHAQRQWFRDFASEPVAQPPSKLFASAFVLWLLFGWTGAHRFYVGRWITGLLYLFSFGGLGVGWGMDLFGLRADVQRANAANRSSPRLAPWADETRYGVVDFLARLTFFIVAPGAFAWLCVVSGHYELLLVLLFTLIVCGLFGDVQRSIKSFEWLRQLPFTRPATQVAQQLYEFYSVNRPRSFWFYLFAPITAPIVWLRSANFREESKLFLQFLGTIVGAVLINQFRQVLTTYQYHSLLNIALFIALHIVVATAIAAAMLTPILTTTYAYNLSGRVRRLRILSICALCVTCLCGLGAVGWAIINQQPSHLSYLLISQRLNDATFQDQLTQSSKLFLEHYVERVPSPLDEMYPLASHPGLTQHYRDEVLAALTPANEGKVFRVFTMRVEGDPAQTAWVGVGMLHDEYSEAGWRTLFLMSPAHEFYTAWDENTPPRVREDFATASALWNMQYEHRLARRSPQRDLSLYDAAELFLHELQGRLASQPAAQALRATPITVGIDGINAVFDPSATREMRRRLAGEWGADALRFRVFRLAPNRSDQSDQAPWLGVMDGPEPLCVLTPWGDFFRAWDRDIFAPYQAVVQKMDQQVGAYSAPATHELRADRHRSRALRFLNQYISDARHADELTDQLTPYLANPNSKVAWRLAQWPIGEESEARWLVITANDQLQYALSPERRFYWRDGSRIEDVSGETLPYIAAPNARVADQRGAGELQSRD